MGAPPRGGFGRTIRSGHITGRFLGDHLTPRRCKIPGIRRGCLSVSLHHAQLTRMTGDAWRKLREGIGPQGTSALNAHETGAENPGVRMPNVAGIGKAWPPGLRKGTTIRVRLEDSRQPGMTEKTAAFERTPPARFRPLQLTTPGFTTAVPWSFRGPGTLDKPMSLWRRQAVGTINLLPGSAGTSKLCLQPPSRKIGHGTIRMALAAVTRGSMA